jgi:hypothetical protein
MLLGYRWCALFNQFDVDHSYVQLTFGHGVSDEWHSETVDILFADTSGNVATGCQVHVRSVIDQLLPKILQDIIQDLILCPVHYSAIFRMQGIPDIHGVSILINGDLYGRFRRNLGTTLGSHLKFFLIYDHQFFVLLTTAEQKRQQQDTKDPGPGQIPAFHDVGFDM